MDKEFLVDAVAQFLQSSEWLDAISGFLQSKYSLFLSSPDEPKESKEHTLEQYDVFLAFKDLAERLLEKLIGDLGCTGEDLVLLLEQNLGQQTTTTGERRFFIRTLLAFDDYDAFFNKISQYAAEQQANDRTEGNGEISEWKLQEAIAKSILEAKSLGQIDEADEGLVSWAEALINQCQAMQESAASDSAETDDEKSSEGSEQEEKMKLLEHTLIKERLKVDLLIAQRIASANAQMKQQMLHLDAAAQEESSDEYAMRSEEDELAALFTQMETIQTRLKDVKKQCFEFKSVGQPAMDTMYLYLKEKVHYQQDLVSQEKEISEFIFTQIRESDASVIPLLLEWLLLESEGLRVQHQIQEQLDGGQAAMPGVDEGYWVQTWDDASQACYYLHSVSGESLWDPPSCGYLDMNQQFQGHAESQSFTDESPDSSDQVPANEDITAQEYAQSYDTTYGDTSEVLQQFEQATTQLDAVYEQAESTDANKLLEMESVLERISREHDEERKRLELVMQVEKARQKEELRKRKEKKRKERLAKKKNQTRIREAEVKDQEKPLDEPKVSPRATLSPRLAIVPTSPRMVDLKAESKGGAEPVDEDNGLNIYVPGHGLVDLTHLLSDSHAKRIHERKGTAPPSMTLLNPASLRYLTEKMVKEQPNVWGLHTNKSEIVLEEVESMNADAK